MACTLHVAWDDQLAGYDFGAGHPMAPVRVELTIELARAFGLFAAAGVSVERPESATDGQLETVHLRRYVAAVRQAGGPAPDPSLLDFGLGTEDNPVFAGMHDASALVAGATLAAARAVWTGTARASRAACITRCAPARAGSACTTTRRSRSPGCSPREPGGSPTSTSTCTTLTGCRPPSTTIRGC
jgi:acetoin utilization protein AcuC